MKYLLFLLLLGCNDLEAERVRVARFANDCMTLIQEMKYINGYVSNFRDENDLRCVADIVSTCKPVKVKTSSGKEGEVILCDNVRITEKEMPGILRGLQISKGK